MLKRPLRSILESKKVTDEELGTTMYKIVRILNNRPIGAMSNDPNDPMALTPSHFMLMGGYGESLMPFDDLPTGLKHLGIIEQVVAEFYRRLCLETINTLRSTPKWITKQRALTVGDVVVLLGDEYKAAHRRFPLGRILKVRESHDGSTRRYTVELANKICIERDARKLCRLVDTDPYPKEGAAESNQSSPEEPIAKRTRSKKKIERQKQKARIMPTIVKI